MMPHERGKKRAKAEKTHDENLPVWGKVAEEVS